MDHQLRSLLQETIPHYQRQLTALQQEKEQWARNAQGDRVEVAQLRQRLLQPQMAPTTYGLIESGGRSGGAQGESLRIDFTDQVTSRTLTVSFPIQGLKTYAAEITDKDGAVVWTSGAQPILRSEAGGAHMSVSLTLQKGFLAAGKYRLKISGQNLKKHPIAEYALNITSP